jgi:hypothetical protein
MKLISLEEKNKNIESEAKGKEYVEEAEKWKAKRMKKSWNWKENIKYDSIEINGGKKYNGEIMAIGNERNISYGENNRRKSNVWLK